MAEATRSSFDASKFRAQTPTLQARKERVRVDLQSTRRRVVIGGLALSATLGRANAQVAYPDKPIKVIVPFGPGGLADVTIRIVGEKLGGLLGQQIVVVNQPGAGGVTAAKAVMSAPADGYTLALFTNGTAVSAALVKALAIDPVKEFEPVSSLGYFDFLFLSAGNGPFKTLQDFVDAAKAKPGTLNIGTINLGSTQNLTAALLKSVTGIDCAIVPFRTTPDVMTAVLRGDVQVAVEGFAAAKGMMADGQLRALASSAAKRGKSTPDIPTVQEAGVRDFEVDSWNAVFAPAGTPKPIVELLSAKIGTALADPAVAAKLLELGIEARASRPDEIGARLKADIAKWGAVIDRAGIPRQ
jgi:tripartite-type tricarboxylate transporter receptor subunit TctC